MIDTFLGEAPALVATLRSSQEGGDAELLRRAAHTLKSNGQTFGAADFAELCRELEQRAKNGELEGAAGLVERIEQRVPARSSRRSRRCARSPRDERFPLARHDPDRGRQSA